MTDDDLAARTTVVLLTHDCAPWIDDTLDHLYELGLPTVAVDNASTDDTRQRLLERSWLRTRFLPANIGAAARDEGVRASFTDYVVFCDDDGWWERNGIALAVERLDRHPRLALVNARITVGEDETQDPISAEMDASPLPDRHGIPGRVLMSFMGGAVVVRVSAYLRAGGYHPRFFIGGEEETLAFCLLRDGWALRYEPDVVMHHRPSEVNAGRIRHYGTRNTLWNAWIHRRPANAVRWTWFVLRHSPHNRSLVRGALLALRGSGWALARRRPLSVELDGDIAVLDDRRRAAARVFGTADHTAAKYPADAAD